MRHRSQGIPQDRQGLLENRYRYSFLLLSNVKYTKDSTIKEIFVIFLITYLYNRMKDLSKYFLPLFFTFLLLIGKQAQANHMYGGELSYKCLGGNNFQITITLYQNCLTEDARNAIAYDNPVEYAIYENSPGYPFFTSDNSTNVVSEFLEHGFSNECIDNIPSVCLQKSTFVFNVALPPSIYGYTIAYQRCCRNMGIINLVNSGNIGVTYEATIPPFATGVCPNNSPNFINQPPQIICGNVPFAYSYAAIDPDGDSLVYRLCTSNIGASMDVPIPAGMQISKPPYTPATYNGGLTFDNPINAIPPAFINPTTGLLTMTPITAGRYQIKVCIDEYRDGIMINTHSRDLQYVIANCNKNVIADLPNKSTEPNVYIIKCDNYTVNFENSSSGATTYYWEFGDGGTSEAETPSHTYTDTGAYLIKLVVNRGLTCTDSTTRIVKIYPYFTADFEVTGKRCPGEPLNFVADITFNGENPPVSIEWDFGDGTTASELNTTHTFAEGDVYTVRFMTKSKMGCEYTVEKEIDIRNFIPNAGNDTIIVLGYDFNLTATGGSSYQWSPADYLSDPFIATPRTSFPNTGTYTYTVDIQSEEGCGGMDTINILVVDKPSILMPNAFSPNGDGLNDVFRPKIIGYPFVNFLRVFDRWGEVVFVSYKTADGWNGTYKGKIAESGVYFYEISVRTLEGKAKYQKGDVTLIR